MTPSFADIDAVTIDGFGTLLGLVDPAPKLAALLPEKSEDEIRAGLRAEADYYQAHSHAAGNATALLELRSECARTFNEAAAAELSSEEFNGAFEFEVLPGVVETLEGVRSRGLSLAVVANWDFGIYDHLREHELEHYFTTIVVSAELGARKPDPRPFQAALERLGVPPARAVHVGDDPAHDEAGALAAGMRFLPAPLATAFEGWA